MSRDRILVAQPLVDLGAALEGYAEPAFGVDCRGAVFAVAGKADACMILRWEPAQLQTVELRLDVAATLVQPFGDGVLLAGGDGEARALDWRGNARARLTLGAGLKDLRVTPDGNIWCAYGDVSRAGLRSFGGAGQPRFVYRDDAAGTEPIDDVYALNVGGDDDAWIYAYSEFPIVRVHHGRYHVWHTSVTGARALAIRGNRALLLGDYRRADVVRVLELGAKGSATVADERRLVDANGAPVAATRVLGAGAQLFIFAGRNVMIVRDW